MTTSAPLDSSRSKILTWSIFLGMSWTWCIGMYFPVLLIRQYGLWGWIVFALPNVLGSAIAGSVLGSAERSKKLLTQHEPAAVVFSIVTIAFHVFFIAWLIRLLLGTAPAAGAFLLTAVFLLLGGTRRDLWLAIFVFAFSIAVMVFAFTQPMQIGQTLARADPKPELLGLTPVCMVGFFLCPYLDLTYHRARQNLVPLAGATAFQIGFFGPFLLMIVFTLCYARWLDQWTNNLPLLWAIGVYLTVQSALTMAFHTRALFDHVHVHRWWVVLFLACAAALAMGEASIRYPIFRHQETGEVIYLCFMGFYGLVFPAYVWLCVFPPAGEKTGVTAPRLARVIAASVIAFPFYWMGFVERQGYYLIPGVLILLLSRFTFPRARPLT